MNYELLHAHEIDISVIFGRPFVKRFALCYRTVVCLSVPSVCDVGVLWPNGRLDCHLVWMYRPRPGPDRVRCGPSSPLKKGHSAPIFDPCLLWPNGWTDQDATWYGVGPQPRRHGVRWEPTERGTASPFRPMSIVAKRSPIPATAELLLPFWCWLTEVVLEKSPLSRCLFCHCNTVKLLSLLK